MEKIASTDECKFSLSGSLNKKNCRIWGSERSNEVYETLQDSISYVIVGLF